MAVEEPAVITNANLLEDRPKAFKIEPKGVVAWIPKSMLISRSNYPATQQTSFKIPEWLAEEKGLKYD